MTRVKSHTMCSIVIQIQIPVHCTELSFAEIVEFKLPSLIDNILPPLSLNSPVQLLYR